MEKEFVPYELAVKLKELGFDEPCLVTYHNNFHTIIPIYAVFKRGDYLKAPLWQQAFDFLLKKYYLYSVIIPTITMCWTFKTTTVVDGEIEVPPYKNVDATDYTTYEEARKTCLEKLIQILEEKK